MKSRRPPGKFADMRAGRTVAGAAVAAVLGLAATQSFAAPVFSVVDAESALTLAQVNALGGTNEAILFNGVQRLMTPATGDGELFHVGGQLEIDDLGGNGLQHYFFGLEAARTNSYLVDGAVVKTTSGFDIPTSPEFLVTGGEPAGGSGAVDFALRTRFGGTDFDLANDAVANPNTETASGLNFIVAYLDPSVPLGDQQILSMTPTSRAFVLFDDGDPFDNDHDDMAIIVQATPVPAALPLFLAALGALGLFGWRRHGAPAV